MNNLSGIIDLVPESLRSQWSADGTYPNRSVYELFCQKALNQPDQLAVLSLQDSMTYGELLDKAKRLAYGLRDLGICAGDVVAYQLNNSWRSCAIDLAVSALGAVVAPFPPGRGRLDIESLLRRCSARALIIEPEYGDLDLCELVESLRSTLLPLRYLVVNGDARLGWYRLEDLFNSQIQGQAALPYVDADAPVRLLVSSGTESEPKLVAYSHNALVGGRGRFLQRLHPNMASFRGLYLVPLGSSFGSTATFGVLSWLGGTVVLLPKFDVQNTIEAIEKLHPTHLLGVPTMLQRIAAELQKGIRNTSSLQAVVSGGALIDEVSIQRAREAFGCDFISLYGSADGVNCHTMPGDQAPQTLYSVGKPNPSVCCIRIVNENGDQLSDGQVGEVLARGPLSPMQYVNAPELDQRYRDEDGWVHTGDLGFLDDQGYLVLSGRKKDIIIRGGANISPVQIENLATSHPDVISAACVAVADADLGHRVCICLTMRESVERLSLAQLSEYLRSQGLEVNKLPEYLRYYRQLPLSPAGKVDKKRLTKEVAELQAAAELSTTGVRPDAGAQQKSTGASSPTATITP